jgi:predicted nucleotidyltransferase
MSQLSAAQRTLLDQLVGELAKLHGVAAIVLGGSYARGRATAQSDIDVGLLYSEAEPFSLGDLHKLAARINDLPGPVVSDFYEWGPWVNGGAWLTIGGQRVDLLYRSLEHLERVINEAGEGRFEVHYDQQPPFGFFSATYLGELQICVPLWDPAHHVDRLKRRVARYPEALRRSVVQSCLWAVEFGLGSFAPKFAGKGDVYGTVGCLARTARQLVMTLFALNRIHFINDKTALAEVAEFARAPHDFGPRLEALLAHPGRTPEQLAATVYGMVQLFRETVDLSEGLYQPKYPTPA